MKFFSILAFLYLSITTSGQLNTELPKPVSRMLNNLYKKQEIVLKELNAGDQNAPDDRFYAIHTAGSPSPAAYLHLGTVKTCRTGGCSGPAVPAPADFSGEYFDYAILFNALLAVETIQVFNYQASYGHEIAARGWLKQFQGFSGEKKLEPGKNIDGISGATVSVHAITSDVQWKTKMLQEMVQKNYSSNLSKP